MCIFTSLEAMNNNEKTGLIIGIVLILLISISAAIVLGIWCFRKNKKKNKYSKDNASIENRNVKQTKKEENRTRKPRRKMKMKNVKLENSDEFGAINEEEEENQTLLAEEIATKNETAKNIGAKETYKPHGKANNKKRGNMNGNKYVRLIREEINY